MRESPSFPAFLAELRDAHRFALGREAFDGDFTAWQEAARGDIQSVLTPQADLVPSYSVLSQHVADGFLFQRLAISFPVGGSTRAFFLRPEGRGPFPAVLLLHDHGSRFDIGKEKVVAARDRPEDIQRSRDWTERYYGGRFIGDWLARHGYAVLAIDALGWGDRSVGDYENQQALAANLMQFGLSWAGIIAAHDNWSANLLCELPGVDAGRMGALGLSMGAFRAWQLAAVSPHIKAFASICWMARMQGLMVPGNNQLRGQSAYAMLHPRLAGRIDYPEVAALAAPKPALFIAGSEDGLFPVPSVEAAFRVLDTAWRGAGAKEALTTRLRAGGHAFTLEDQAVALDLLDKALKGCSAVP